MKSMKKFLALALALALCFVMAVPALATGDETQLSTPIQAKQSGTAKLTVGEATEGHTYSVYQIFAGDKSENDAGKVVLSTVLFGVNYGATQLVPEDKSNDSVTAGTAVPQEVLSYFEGLSEEELTEWAKGYKPYGDPVAILTAPNYSAEDLPTGYYVIIDNDLTFPPEEGKLPVDNTVSAIMVQVVGDTTVKAKTTTPELTKETDPDNADQYQPTLEQLEETTCDKYGHKIGEDIPYHLTATIPVKYLHKYDSYYAAISDTMDAGLTFKAGSLKVSINGTEVTDVTKYKVEGSITENGALKETDTAGADFKVVFENILPQLQDKDGNYPEKDVTVTVDYIAYLNSDALVFPVDGNKNTAKLEYSRDPQDESDHGETPPDVVTIFTFNIDGFKYETVAGEEKPLPGAGFTLYQEDGTTVIPLYKKTESGVDKFFVCESAEQATELGLTAVKDNEIKSDSNGDFIINGLKPGKYVIKETSWPQGYNKAPDMEITVTITGYTEGTDGELIPTLSVKRKNLPTDGVADVNDTETDQTNTELKVENKKGTLLPSTGGIGTTIFYAVGGALVVGAGVLLFVRKRMGSKG